MRLIPHHLAEFAPELADHNPETLAETLTNLGFETELLPGKTTVLDVSITPNRADAMSALGLARELTAHRHRNATRVRTPLVLTPTGTTSHLPEADLPHVTITNPRDVVQYHGVVFEDVRIEASPAWLQEELILLGVRPINNIVDVTNYLMELTGQPLHAFDLDAILGSELTIRRTKAGERITTLDGVERALPEGVLVIEDREALVDLAGVMGGANSEVHQKTSRVFLQSAIFARDAIRRSTNRTGHRTTAAMRYERGVDPAVSYAALDRAITLLGSKAFGGARPVARVIAKDAKPRRSTIPYNPARVSRLLGFAVPAKTQRHIFALLGCVETDSESIVGPSWRFDLERWQDLAEEVARFIGLNTDVPAKRLTKWPVSQTRSELEWAEGLKDRLVELGLAEVLTYSFLGKDDLTSFELPTVGELANPLNPALRYLRPSLLPNLATVVAANSVFDPILVFEIGHVFRAQGEALQLGIAIAGQSQPTSAWIAKIADAIGIDSAAFELQARILELPQSLKNAYKIRKRRVTLIEIPLDSLRSARRIPAKYRTPTTIVPYRPLSKFPPVSRDVALSVSRELNPTDVTLHIERFHELVEHATLFDEFVSDSLGEGKKSLAFHVLYASLDHTLTDKEIDTLHRSLEDSLTTAFDATIR